jgi:secreted trypsin-like serine protease
MARTIFVLLCLILLPSGAAAQSEKRFALLIGNQGYDTKVGTLKNPHNDITRIGSALQSIGFDVTSVKDAGYGQLNRAINAYVRKLNAAGDGAIGFFYYSGHGARNKETGVNYLIPTDVQSIDTELWDASVPLNSVTDTFKDRAANASHFVVFDACRNTLRLVEPNSKALSQPKGFEPVRVARGMLIAYATAEGELASDSGQEVGPYARVLAEEIVKPGVEAVTMFRSVQLRVQETIKQEPWLSYGALSQIWFAGRERNEIRPASPTPITSPVPLQLSEAAEAWDRTKDVTNIAALEVFIARYASSYYADLARLQIEELKKRQTPIIPPRVASSEAVTKAPRSSCEPRLMRVVGGTTARAKDWPGLAVLRIHASEEKSSLYLCGATAIHKDWVVTAAHCVANIKPDLQTEFVNRQQKSISGTIQVVMGVDDLNSVKDENVYEVDKIIKHEEFTDAVKGKNIALLKLKRPYAGPLARLSLEANTDPQTPPGARVGVTGYGSLRAAAPVNAYRTSNGEEYLAGSRRLLEAFLPTVATTACKARYPAAKIDEEEICAGFEQGGLDACQGDSGGALVAIDGRGCPYQVGIISWGAGCAAPKDYGVYTRISYHARWLERHVGSLESVTSADLQVSVTLEKDAVWRVRTALEDVLAGAGHVRIGIKGGKRIAVGGDVIFTLQSDIPGRLIVLNINASGDLTSILPNQIVTSAVKVTPGSSLTVPGSDYGFKAFKAAEPVGQGLLIALVVPDSFPLDGAIADKTHSVAEFLPIENPTRYLTNLVQKVTAAVYNRKNQNSPPTDWALDITDYEIVK